MQSVFFWKPEYSVSNFELDEQHQKLFALVGKLADSVRRGEASSIKNDIFAELIAYTQFHFADEERLLKKFAYPTLDAHIEEHRALKRRVLEFKAEYDEGIHPIPSEMLAFLNDWLVNHIVGTDVQYARFLRDRGVH